MCGVKMKWCRSTSCILCQSDLRLQVIYTFLNKLHILQFQANVLFQLPGDLQPEAVQLNGSVRL